MSENSKFQFKGYKVTKSIFDFETIPSLEEIKIGFNLSGSVINTNNQFVLNLGIHITNEGRTSNILVESQAVYSFDDDLKVDKTNDLNDLFYLNSIALLFPHIRAYITALTSLSGNAPLILPTLNISSLKDDLKENITIEY